MKLLTERTALELTRLTWMRVASGECDKREAARRVAHCRKMGRPLHDCFCCAYVAQQVKEGVDGMDCADLDPSGTRHDEYIAHCPLRELWPDGCQESGPYHNYQATLEEEARHRYAEEIVDGCTDALAKLKPA